MKKDKYPFKFWVAMILLYLSPAILTLAIMISRSLLFQSENVGKSAIEIPRLIFLFFSVRYITKYNMLNMKFYKDKLSPSFQEVLILEKNKQLKHYLFSMFFLALFSCIS